MTKEKAINMLAELKGVDQESDHGDALEEIGEVEVTQAYRDARTRIGFWYA